MANFRTLNGLKKAIQKAINNNNGFINNNDFYSVVCGDNSAQHLLLTNNYWKLWDEGFITTKEVDTNGFGRVENCIILGDKKHIAFKKEMAQMLKPC